MARKLRASFVTAIMLVLVFPLAPAAAHKLREKGVAVTVAGSEVLVTPTREWNKLDGKLGKHTETWTLDGRQLNDVTFFAGVPSGEPLFRERSKKREPLPKFTAETLLVEIPELLEGTYRANGQIASFTLVKTEPAKFLGRDGIFFEFEFADADQLTRRGQAFAAVIDQKLYMVKYEAPRLAFYDKYLADFQLLASSAKLP